jgi:Holliday junction resolvase
MPRYPRRRDANEKEIVSALERIGASVQRLDASGVPDLLVGFGGHTYLIEVKQKHGTPGAKMKKSDDGLLDSQRSWWSRWRGQEPVIVTTFDEALMAIGAR